MTTAKILRMNDADTNKFVILYKNEPVLWDPSREEYKKRECRAAAARRIAAEMDIRGFTEVHVVIKFKNLRSSYMQELKKIKQSMKSGCSPDEVYTPKVGWFTIMDGFLKPHVKSRENQLNLEPFVSIIEASPEDNETPSQQLYEKEASTSKEEKWQSDSLKRKIEPSTPTIFRKQKLSSIPAENDVNSSTEKLDDVRKRPANDSVSTEDCFDHFGKYIASLLRTLPEERSFQLQSEIVSLILKPSNPI
ncbi:uncharacterized protein LOC126886376 [Diabrotica virgifera virgifera]|uniref:MADF domain-containing protein n=1 Tax=Diabrotica virgifera virgifera TaxID=50390 RepID=A0ABM5KGB5_DIAVI|nr:uncharacterized protein LOC126886376 [Diabrotica virgifera virgifera]